MKNGMSRITPEFFRAFHSLEFAMNCTSASASAPLNASLNQYAPTSRPADFAPITFCTNMESIT